ncbi:hypothetical protein [Ramlibacter sp. Leaf400]|uniref:hypothetical protein n=1 Tax=Ramlibacter sp. Leaf400 TaxID=1736365 RepID=UPI0006F4983C|nr:hypothetical protein [Ramlibacter sp. Leaf400]KQT08733.1 hypothetical protein ASG30_14695 [Ramlibacter sp. Leaf400]
MNDNITTTAAQVVEAFGVTAHGAIDAYRAGGERLGRFAAERWDIAFEQARPRLSAETRRNAANARKVFARYYRQGLQLSSSGAGTAVDTLVQAADGALARARARA